MNPTGKCAMCDRPFDDHILPAHDAAVQIPSCPPPKVV